MIYISHHRFWIQVPTTLAISRAFGKIPLVNEWLFMFESIGDIKKLHDLIYSTEILSFEFFKLFIVSDTSWAVVGKKNLELHLL